MEIRTTRFGTLSVQPDDLIGFPNGVLGLQQCRQWVLLADAQNEAVGWLQCHGQPETALPVVSPRRFVPGYQIRVARRDLASLQLDCLADAQVLVIVGRNDDAFTLNLKAPLVINLERRLGCQVVAKDAHPLQYEIPHQPLRLKKSA
jgi:flagellar assembly factor FliW